SLYCHAAATWLADCISLLMPASASCPGGAPLRVLGDSFFFNDRAPTELYTLSLHDALPIYKGKDTRDYLAAAFPELNAWERAGADASSAGMVDAGFENQKELTKMQLDNQKEIAEMQNETQKEIAGIQSATSRQNT